MCFVKVVLSRQVHTYCAKMDESSGLAILLQRGLLRATEQALCRVNDDGTAGLCIKDAVVAIAPPGLAFFAISVRDGVKAMAAAAVIGGVIIGQVGTPASGLFAELRL